MDNFNLQSDKTVQLAAAVYVMSQAIEKAMKDVLPSLAEQQGLEGDIDSIADGECKINLIQSDIELIRDMSGKALPSCIKECKRSSDFDVKINSFFDSLDEEQKRELFDTCLEDRLKCVCSFPAQELDCAL